MNALKRLFSRSEEVPPIEDTPAPSLTAVADSAIETPREERIASNGNGRPADDQLRFETVSFLNQDGAYENNLEHLWHELSRIDQLLRAQTLRWRALIADHKPEQYWGMIYVSEREIDRYLESPYLTPDLLHLELEKASVSYQERAGEIAGGIRQRLSRTPDVVHSLRLWRLQSLFGLTPAEKDVLLVCLLPELDGRYRRLMGYLQDDAARTQPSVELLLQIVKPSITSIDEERSLLNAAAALRSNHMITLHGPGDDDRPLSTRFVHIDERIVAYLLGDDRPDSRLSGMMSKMTKPAGWDGLIMAPHRLERLKQITKWWGSERQRNRPGATVFMHGPYGSDRLAAAQTFARPAADAVLKVEIGRAQPGSPGWFTIVDLAYREALLADSPLYWAGCEALLEPEGHPEAWAYLMDSAEGHKGLTFLASETSWEPAGRFQSQPFLRLAFPLPDYDTRLRLWRAILPSVEEFAAPGSQRQTLVQALANGFQFTHGQIRDAVSSAWRLARLRNPDKPLLTVEDLYTGCRRQSSKRLISMARRVEPRDQMSIDRLVLPEQNQRQLDELRARITLRSRVYSDLGFGQRLSLGKGVIALFTGSSGTGKTMAAESLAQEQSVDLYKVDLSAVVSKYVGETEKNLSQIFAEAEDANAIIFFDEADALFGKRGEVREARDRWANIEVNFLLQRIEEFSGVVIMTSNLRQNIDEAFLRRIHVIVEFPFPGEEARLSILKGLFPDGLSIPEEDDLKQLTDRFRLSGGSWKNIAIDATFRALANGRNGSPSVTVRDLVLATGREYQKLGKPLTKGEFGPAFYKWVERDIFLIPQDDSGNHQGGQN